MMFSLARESRGLTQSELASRVGVKQGTISKIENGSLEPPADLVEKFASALGYPARLFSHPIEPRNLPVTFYRKRKSLSATATKRIEAALNLRRLHLITLLRAVDVPENRVPSVDLSEHCYASAREVARELRVRWHVPRGPIQNLTNLLESIGILVVRCDFGSSLVDGISIYEKRDHLPPVIFVSQSLPTDRMRFTLAHELAHIVLHHHMTLPPDEAEEEADALASEFLMPASDIRGHLTRVTVQSAIQLKSHWRVSAAAIIMRAASLGRINQRQKQYLFMQLGQLGYPSNEPGPLSPEEPTLVSEIVSFHLTDLGYDDRSLSDALMLTLDEFREQYRQPSNGLRVVRS